MKKLLIFLFMLPLFASAQENQPPIYVDQSGFIKLRPNYRYMDSVVYNFITKDTTVLNVIAKDTVVLNVVPKDTTILRIAYRDTLIYNISYKDTCLQSSDPNDPGPVDPGPTDPPPATGEKFVFNLSQRTDNYARPGAGTEQWHDQYRSPSTPAIDKYFRFVWRDFEDLVDGGFDFAVFDAQIRDAINKRQKFGFGIMVINPSMGSGSWYNSKLNSSSKAQLNGHILAYPTYLHNLMQGAAVKDYAIQQTEGSRNWIPNWNSEFFHSRFLRMNQALNNHIMSTSYNGVAYKDVINYIDVRGYGYYGEWWLEDANKVPAGTIPTIASFKRMIDAHVQAYPDFPLVILIGAFDGNRLNNTKVPPEVGYHALTVRNNWGPLGWRRDNWGAMDDYIRRYTDLNPNRVNGMRLDTAIMNRWQYAPIVGEPCCNATYSDLENQVRRYRAVSFGNGNFSPSSTINPNIARAGLAAGHKLTIDSGYFQGGKIVVHWRNSGITPVYEDFDTYFELRSTGGAVTRSWKSASSVKLKLPGTWTTTDTVSNLPSGTYELHVVIKNNFRSYPLGITTSKVATVKL